MLTIKLANGVWHFDETNRLGKPSGFAEVFRGTANSGEVAIKRLKHGELESAAREIRIAAELADKSANHIVPILDYGLDLDSGRYYLVMPVCDCSLDDWLTSNSPTASETAEIGRQIVSGLLEAGDLVHRDLKPSNILFYNDRWVIADFGIAKFAEESTSINTLKGALTAPYAAPEQWDWELQTKKTDVYSLGCVLYRMIAGAPPFIGTTDECKRGHISMPPPPFDCDSAKLASLILMMLRKSREGRPSLSQCRDILSTVTENSPRTSSKLLQEVARNVETTAAAAQAEAKRLELRRSNFALLSNDAKREFEDLTAQLISEISSAIPNLAVTSGNKLTLGKGSIEVGDFVALDVDAAKAYDRFNAVSESDYGPFHIAGYSKITVRCEIEKVSYSDPNEYYWSATLFYGPTKADLEYRWREVGFWEMRGRNNRPFSIPCTVSDFYDAFSNTVTSTNIAYGPLVIDGGGTPSFIMRWENLFAQAAAGQLRPPSQMPLPKFYLDRLGS